MKRILLIIASMCIMFSFSGCSSKNDNNNCNCSQNYLYRKTISISDTSSSGWKQETNIYEQLPENAEIIEIFDLTTDSHYPKYDIIYTIHHC